MIVAIEGGDQAGKKTQTAMLAKALRRQNIKTATFSFPDYRTPIGKEISRHLARGIKSTPQVIHCLMAANRWEKLDKITNAASNHSVVIMNRYYHSNLVYGTVNGLKPGWLENLERGLPKTDLVILLDMPARESFHRKKINRDRFETNEAFLEGIMKTYRTVAKRRHWKIIDASQSRQKTHQDIINLVSKKLGT